MKIIQVAPCFVDINKETGGVANIVRQICLTLSNKKIDTILICTTTELGIEVANEEIIEFSEFLTIHVVKQFKNPLLGPRKKILSLLETIDNVSLVHIHTCFSSITENALKFCIKHNVKCVFTPHGKLSSTMFRTKFIFKTIYFNVFLKRNLNKVTSIITSSSNEINYVKKKGINVKAKFIYNGYSNPDLKLTKSHLSKLEKLNYILFLGYLDPRKQPDLLVKAFRLSKASEFFKLVLAGPDSYDFQKEIVKLCEVEKLEIGKDVIFTGRVMGGEKWELLKNAKALFLPSKGEGWPVVIAEAIGVQTPCVISKECNFNEIISLKIGIEVSDFSINKWANAIDEICFNESTYTDYKNNLYNIRNDFSWQSITEQWLTTYKEIIYETRIK